MPTSKQRVSVNLSDSEYAELAALADRHNLSMAWIGHKAILDFLEKNRDETLQPTLTFAKHPGGTGREQSKFPRSSDELHSAKHTRMNADGQ